MQQTDGSQQQDQKLFISFTEQLRQSVLQIARTAEIAPALDGRQQKLEWQLIQEIAENVLGLSESYMLQASLHNRMYEPDVQAVTLGSMLYDTAHALSPMAKRLGVQLQLDESTNGMPIMTDPHVFRAALLSLGQVFVVAQSQTDEGGGVVRLSAHRSRYGIVTGVYSEQQKLSAAMLRRARKLHGNATQPLSSLVTGSGAGVFIAENLFEALSTKLHVAKYKNFTGLAATVPPCQQLQFV